MQKQVGIDLQTQAIPGGQIRFFNLGCGEPVLFHHANGFPAAVYKHFLEQIPAQICAINANGFAGSKTKAEPGNWHDMADDINSFIQQRFNQPVTAIGHSLGAVLFSLAAEKKPTIFKKLILLDPVFLPRKFLLALRLLKLFGQIRRFPLAQKASQRRERFPDRETIINYFRSKSVFTNCEDLFFENYAYHGFVSEDDLLRLSCKPETEAAIFSKIPLNIWQKLEKIQIPIHIIYGENSDTFTEASAKRAEQMAIDLHKIPNCGHLLLFERSADCAIKVQSLL